MICLFTKNFGIKTQKDPVKITKIKREKHILEMWRKRKWRQTDPRTGFPALIEHLLHTEVVAHWITGKPQSLAPWSSQFNYYICKAGLVLLILRHFKTCFQPPPANIVTIKIGQDYNYNFSNREAKKKQS